MTFKKLPLTTLKELAIKYNSIIGKHSPATLLDMTKQELITLLLEWTTLNDKQIEYYIYIDIKKYIHKLEGQKISFEYDIITTNNNLISPFILPEKETIKENFIVKDFRLQEIIKGIDKLNNKITTTLQIRDFTSFKGEKLSNFYIEFMKMAKEKTIFDKLKECKPC